MTRKQRRVLEVLAEFIRAHGYSPSVREIGNIVGIGSPTVKAHLDALRTRGYVKWHASQPRTLRVLRMPESEAS